YLPLSAYDELGQHMPGACAQRGGLQVALALRADAVIAELLAERQKLARRIFLRLVQSGEGRADTRRQQSLDQLRSVADVPGSLDETVEFLAARRLLTLSGIE